MGAGELTGRANNRPDPGRIEPSAARAPMLEPTRTLSRSAESRRSETRTGIADTGRKSPSGDETRFYIPRNWNRMAIALAAAFLCAGGVALRIPGWVEIALAATAIGLTGPGRWLAKCERREGASRNLRLGLATVAIVAPLFLTGMVVGGWVFGGGLDIRWGVATLVALNAASTALLNGRLAPMFSAKLASWAGFALVDGSAFAFAALGGLSAAFLLVYRYQARLDRAHAEKIQARERVRTRAEEILRDYEETGQGWFWETDRRGQITYLSKAVAKTLGRRPNELIGRSFTELFELGDDSREGERTLAFHLSARSAFQELAVRAAVVEEERWWSVSGRPVYDTFRNFCGFRGSGTDLTEKKRSQEQASRLARYDSLTGLANRFQMSQSLEKILTSPLELNRDCSVLLLDLDRFKHVNDTLGHPAGDTLLKQVAQRLERAVGKMGLVGRLGGDEFEVIVPERLNRERLGDLAAEIIAALSQPYSIEGQRVAIGVSVGISLAPEHGLTSESLIRNADLALYAAKDGGRGRYHFYSDDLHSAAEERSELEQDLRDAITSGGLELFYQPVVDTATEQISGFEALLRWCHPKKGWLSPEKFVPIAEDTGLIASIGEWALRTACHDLAGWPAHVRCAVNVSPLQFANPNLPTVVTNAIAQAGIQPSRLELEITESVFLNDDKDTDAMFAALKRVGVRLALDDFGTGYSSLGYLKKAPFDKIKIDQSFVRGATEPGSRNGAIIASITSLAQALGMDTTAEGVETLDELDLIRMYGCSHVQGYIYEQALGAEAATERLRNGLTAVAHGPRSSRATRQTMLRKIVLEHGGQHYTGTIRNISTTGALVEGLWNVPAGTIFRIALSDSKVVTGTTRWCEEHRMGLEFAVPLERDSTGAILAVAGDSPAFPKTFVRRAG